MISSNEYQYIKSNLVRCELDFDLMVEELKDSSFAINSGSFYYFEKNGSSVIDNFNDCKNMGDVCKYMAVVNEFYAELNDQLQEVMIYNFHIKNN